MRFHKLPVCLIVFCAFVAIASQAQALLITPSSGDLVGPPITRWQGDQTSQAEIDTFIAPIIGSSVELYKSDVKKEPNPPEESGSLSGSYETTFSNSPWDPADALIEYMGGNSVGPTAYLLVKDGNQTPAWYLFNLTALGWNGTADLELKGFWPNGGAISHVALYGNVAVPEPTTMLLLGFGLIGLAGFSRRKFKTN